MRIGQASGDNVEDRRGGFSGGSPGGMLIPVGGGGIISVLAVIVYVAIQLLGGGGGTTGSTSGGQPSRTSPQAGAMPGAPDPDADTVNFVRFVVSDVNGYWAKSFQARGQKYQPAKLVIFDGATNSACGGAEAAVGPHYCPNDQNVYLDLSFFKEMTSRFNAPGDFAQAYVIAHEYGHHVQNISGTLDSVAKAQQQNTSRANDLSVRTELQADCYAGVWAHDAYQQGILEPGDIEEGINAAAAVGDDRLQKQAGRRVNPETWTHGSSQQRVQLFQTGYKSGNPDSCDTFR